MGILLIIFGGVALIGAFFGKEFYAGNDDATGAFEQRSSTWSGRLLFTLVGVFLVALGIKLLMGAH